jgi:hypothetical protein
MSKKQSEIMGSTGIRFSQEQLDRCDAKSRELGISRNEFVRDAVEFYMEWLSRESTEKFLTPAFESVISAKLRDTEDRLSRILFKIAVEQNMLAQVLIYQGKYTEDSVEEVHRRAVEAVKQTNGTLNATDLLIDK